MQRLAITVTFACPDDVPPHVLDWMAANVLEYVEHEFGSDYDADFVRPTYIGPPLCEGTTDVTVATMHGDTSRDERRDPAHATLTRP